MSSSIKEKSSNKIEYLVFGDSTLPNNSKTISVKKAKALEKTLGIALFNRFKNEFNLESFKK
jgi:hypothetical protein